MEPPNFTSSRIAEVLGVARQTIQAYLEGVAATGRIRVNGVWANAWSILSLPERLRFRLDQAAKEKRFRNAEAMLASPLRDWQPRIPLADVDQECIEAAVRLQRALGPSLARRNDMRLSGEEFERLGIEDYTREFGHRITPRYFRLLLNRTLERDAGAENWARLEVYLPEQLKHRTESLVPFSAATGEEFRELHQTIGRFRSPALPTNDEQSLLWLRAFEVFELLQAEGAAEKQLRRRLLRFLWKHAPWLSKSFNALRVKFDDRLQRWKESEQRAESLVDGRTKRHGIPTAPQYEQDSLDRITWHAVTRCGGRVSQAVRELVETDALDPQILRAFTVQRSNKSSIPTRLRERVRYDVEALLPVHQGPRAADKLIPPLDLSYSGIASMKCVQSDDFTMPVYFYVPDGQGWYQLTRGQLLLCIDWRTLFILGYCLYPEGQYNSGLIRTVFTRVFDSWGIPEILYLERSIWKTSKLVTGGEKAARVNRDLPFSEAEVELGLRQYGISFIHARRARSKPVERVGGLLQDLMEGEPFYCGRDERKDCPEVTTRDKFLIARKQKHPAEPGCYSFEQWESRIGEICAAYNKSPQDGKRLEGLSPEESLERYWNKEDPPTRFGPEHRFLLAHHKIPVTVGHDATIKFMVRGERFKYFDADTGRRKGQKLIAWFNPEAPETCTFTNANMRDAFTVARHTPVNGLVADDLYEAEVSKAGAAAGYAKARYRMLKAKFKPSFRPTIASGATVQLGRHIQQEGDRARTRQQRRTARAATITDKARRLGVPLEILGNDERTLCALDLMESARREAASSSEDES